MIPGTLLEILEISRCANAAAAGTTDISATTAVNMAGADGVCFIAAVGTLTASQVTTLKAQSSSDNGVADAFADIANAETAALDDADSNKLMVLDVLRPVEQYVRPYLDRGTANAVLDSIIALKYRVKDLPVTQPASVAVTKTAIDQAAE